MTLDELQQRRQQLEVAINNGTQSVYMLQGHKAEVEFQIAELQKQVDEPPVEQPVEPVVE